MGGGLPIDTAESTESAAAGTDFGVGLHATVEHEFRPAGEGDAAAEAAAAGGQEGGPAGLALPLFRDPPRLQGAPVAEASQIDHGAKVEHDDGEDGVGGPVLDAWYASFGTAVSRALAQEVRPRSPGARTRPTVGQAVAESIIAGDDRVEVDETGDPPYSWICALTITAANGSRWLGTGWLAGPRLLVTAGHCVYLHNSGGWVRDVVIRPAVAGGADGIMLRSSTAFSTAGWVGSKAPAADYGALVLPTSAAGLGWFGYAVRSDLRLRGDVVNVVGYPSDKPAGTMWGNAHTLLPPTPVELLYLNDTYGGMSGAPVIEWDGTDYSVLGIHNYGDVAGNRATRITAEVFHNVRDWVTRANS